MTIDIAALVEQLSSDPQQRAALRAALFGEAPDIEESFARIAAAQAATDERLQFLAVRLDGLADKVETLAATCEGLAKDVRELVRAQRETADSLKDLVDTVKGMNDRLARLDGESLERRYRERGQAYFAPLASRLHLVDPGRLGELTADARDSGVLLRAQSDQLLWVDAVFTGRRDGAAVHLVVEASVTVNYGDVRRARERADLLAKVVDTPVLAVVAGEFIPSTVAQAAEDALVWQVTDGRVVAPEGESADV